jgi:hypothetical protein
MLILDNFVVGSSFLFDKLQIDFLQYIEKVNVVYYFLSLFYVSETVH